MNGLASRFAAHRTPQRKTRISQSHSQRCCSHRTGGRENQARPLVIGGGINPATATEDIDLSSELKRGLSSVRKQSRTRTAKRGLRLTGRALVWVEMRGAAVSVLD